MRLRARFCLIFEKVGRVAFVLLNVRLNAKLLHRNDDSFSAFHQILENRRPVVMQFFFRVSLEVNDLHLLDNRRLAALPRTCYALVHSVRPPNLADMKARHAPSSKILHSFRNFLESSSRTLSIAWLFFFFSASSLFELMQPPILAILGEWGLLRPFYNCGL